MKITDTSIVKTEITKYCIEIHFQPEGAWVDVNERRPEKMCHVLCATDSGYVNVSFYDPTAKLDELKLGRKYCGKWGRYFDLCKRGYKITHWMPLPKAPNDQALPQGGAKKGL